MPIPNRAALRPVSALARVLCVLGVLLTSSAPRAALEEGKNFDALVPPQPATLADTRPNRARVVQSADVFVDAKGLIYATDYNAGLYVLEFDGA